MTAPGKIMQWISVKERLPDPGIDVITWNGKILKVCNRVVFGSGKWKWDGGDENRYELTDKTHWMPLPAPPEEKL